MILKSCYQLIYDENLGRQFWNMRSDLDKLHMVIHEAATAKGVQMFRVYTQENENLIIDSSSIYKRIL